MEQIRSWAFSICCSVLIGSFISMILPEGGIQKLIKNIFCIFFLCTVLSPISQIEIPDFSKNIDDFFVEETEYDETDINSEKYLESKITDTANKILMKENIFAQDILIEINISENESIDINKFVLTIKNPEDADKTADIILDEIGIEPEIIISGENDNG